MLLVFLFGFIVPGVPVIYEIGADWIHGRIDANEMGDPLLLFLGIVSVGLNWASGLLGVLLAFLVRAFAKPRTSN